MEDNVSNEFSDETPTNITKKSSPKPIDPLLKVKIELVSQPYLIDPYGTMVVTIAVSFVCWLFYFFK